MALQEGAVIEGEAQEAHANPQIQEDKWEKAAKKDGWAPEDKWRGEPEDWVTAKEFVQRRKLFDRIDDLKETLKRERELTRKESQEITKQLAEIRAQAHKEALAELKAQRAVAIEDRNTEAVEAIDEQIDSTKEALKETEKTAKEGTKQTQQVQESDAFKEWKGANKWFETNSEAREDAIAIGVGYAAKNPNKTEKQVYDYVASKIQKMYPEEFKTSSKDNSEDEEEQQETKETRKVSSVETSGGPRSGVGSSKKGRQITVADLDDKTKQVMKTLVKRGAFKEEAAKNKRSQEEEFLAQYASNL